MNRRIPDGYAAHGWHSFASGGLSALARLSVVHLVPVDQLYETRGGMELRSHGPAVCGRSMEGRSTRADSPRSVEADLNVAGANGRKPCRRCWEKAVAELHRLTVGRRRVVGGSPVRGGGNYYGTPGSCSCGRHWRGYAGFTAKDLRAAHRDHVAGIVRYGLFDIEDSDPRARGGAMFEDPRLAPALFGYSWGREDIAGEVAALKVGETYSTTYCERPDITVRVTRTEDPYLPEEAE